MSDELTIKRIGRLNATPNATKSIMQMPIAPPFFLVALVTGLIGSACHGIYLWLVLNGVVSGSALYMNVRRAHAAMQVLVLFGGFVSGFLLQAMPRLLETSRLRPLAALWLLPLFTIAAILVSFFPASPYGYLLLSVHFFIVALLIARMALLAPRHALYKSGIPVVWGVAWLVVGSLVDLSDPRTALLVVWGSIVPLIEVSIRRVFFALARVRGEANVAPRMATILYLAAIVSLVCAVAGFASETAWALFSCTSLACIIAYAWRRILPPAGESAFGTPVAFVFRLGLAWMAIASLASFSGAYSADAVLHILSTGVALPLVFVVAPQIVRGHTGVQVLSGRSLFLLAALWQIVPLGRGLGRMTPLAHWLAVPVALVTPLVFTVWAGAVGLALMRSRIGMKRVTTAPIG